MFKDEILSSLENVFKKYDCCLVGGYLRNWFLNNSISEDRDIVVIKSARELAQDIAQTLDGTFIELDKENEIYRVVLKDKKNYFDISKALDDSFETDAKRRDFTINSILYDLNKKEIIDKFNGIDDIKNKIIRAIDFKNMVDDSLRFLRMYRFRADLGFRIDDELLKFSIDNFNLLKKSAPERIQAEIMHIFEGEYLVDTLLEMLDNGALEIVFPFVKEIKKIPSNSHHHLDLVHHSIETVRNIRINKPELKLAAFYHDIGKPSTWTIEENGRHRFIGHDNVGSELVKDELKKYKFSNNLINYVSKMVKYHIYTAALANSDEPTKKAYARFVRKLGKDVVDIIELSRADRLSAQGPLVTKEMTECALNHLERLLQYYKEVSSMVENPKPLLDGIEIMEILNLKPSKKVGDITNSIIEAQLAGDIKTHDEAIDFIKSLK